MPIAKPEKLSRWHPTRGEARIVELLRASKGRGLAYSELKESAGLSDTALSGFVRRLQYYHLVVRDEDRRYRITGIGLMFLMSLNLGQVSKGEVRDGRRRDIARLWREVRRLQEKVLRIMWLPYADEWSKFMFRASGGSPDLIYIGALKTREGKEVLNFKTPTVEELKRLGYIKADSFGQE